MTKTIATAVLFAVGLGAAPAEPAEKHEARSDAAAPIPRSGAAAGARTVVKDKAAAKKDVAADINAPRADARKVSFEAKEGTWLSVDLSPDGQTVVFDLLGDLYLLPVAGGAARAITSGPGWDSQPRFSPDGKTIAFTSDRGGIENIWLMGADGQNARALTEEKDSFVRTAAWTPDGQYLVARKEEGKRAGIPPVELWLYHREGGSGVKLTSSDDINNASGPASSRDGRWIYFAARSGRFNYIPDLSSGLWQVRRFDRTTGETSTRSRRAWAAACGRSPPRTAAGSATSAGATTRR